MRACLTVLALATLTISLGAIAGCGRMTTSDDHGKTARATASARLRSPVENLVVGAPATYGNLTVFPVTSRTPKNDDRYITLDEGLKTGTVEVFEMGQAPRNANPGGLADSEGEPGANPFGNDGNATPNRSPEEPIEPPAPEYADVEFSTPPVAPPPVQQVEIANDFLDDPFQVANQQVGNDVNRLMVVNRSDKPLYLMPGEIILGGSQDRTIGQELVLAPNPEPVPVDVFCVEHGRWGQRGAQATAEMLSQARLVVADSDSLQSELITSDSALLDVAAKADDGKFVASVGQLNRSARMAVQHAKNQSEVWNSVAIENSKAGVTNASGTFTGNYTSDDAVKRLEPYMAALEKKIADEKQIVGVIVAIDGKPQSMDVFESTPLFRKLWPKLLKSYSLDAANEAAASEAHTQASGANKPVVIGCSIASAKRFLADALAGGGQTEANGSGLATTTRRSENIISFAAEPAPHLPMAEVDSAASEASESIHVSAFAQ